ncbi:hypothetical protein [Sulfurisoma sediminicola]|nr:hypothetical protein [Sulfurisoma sediminicola]
MAFLGGIKDIKLFDTIAPWYYRLAPLLMSSLIDDPAMLALAFC